MLLPRPTPPPVKAGTHELRFEHRTLVMGVLNVTPDSFSDGGRFTGWQDAVAAARQMVEEGADIIDVGGESTRPGAPPVPDDEERARVVPVIEALRGVAVPISVDTRKASVARAALDAGANIINDVTAMTYDPAMAPLAAESGAGVVLMHMRGDPLTMQQGPIHYDDVVEDVSRYLEQAAERVARAGVLSSQIMLDPGFGFGKTVVHNLQLMAGLERLTRSGHPVVWGPSRKSTLGVVTGGLPPPQRVVATCAACVMAAERGAHIMRVHDVAAVRQAVAVVDAARGAFIA